MWKFQKIFHSKKWILWEDWKLFPKISNKNMNDLKKKKLVNVVRLLNFGKNSGKD